MKYCEKRINVPKVLLIKPKFDSGLSLLVCEIPLGLEYIAAAIEDDVSYVSIIDLSHQKINLKKEIDKIKPDIVGITSQYAWHNEIVRTTRICRKTRPESIIVAGGYYPSLFPKLLDYIPELDYTVKGEGEQTFLEICKTGVEDPYQVKGIYFRGNGKIRYSGERPPIPNLDNLKFPARKLRQKYYTHLQLPGRFYDSISTIRGCDGRCSFCCEPEMYGRARQRSPENVILEIDEIVEFHQNSPMTIICTDPNFLGRRAADVTRINRLCELLEERKYDLSFSLLIRADTVARNPTLIYRMVRNGFNFFEVGVEAPDKTILQNTKKGQSIKTVQDAIKIIIQAGGFPVGTLMLGFPGQMEAAIRQYPIYATETLGIKEAAFVFATPIVGTGFFKEVQHLIFENDLARFNYLHPTLRFNPQISVNRMYFLLGYCYGGFFTPSLMKENDEFYERLIPKQTENPLLTYIKFGLRSLGEFPNRAKIEFIRGAITGFLASEKYRKKKMGKGTIGKRID